MADDWLVDLTSTGDLEQVFSVENFNPISVGILNECNAFHFAWTNKNKTMLVCHWVLAVWVQAWCKSAFLVGRKASFTLSSSSVVWCVLSMQKCLSEVRLLAKFTGYRRGERWVALGRQSVKDKRRWQLLRWNRKCFQSCLFGGKNKEKWCSLVQEKHRRNTLFCRAAVSRFWVSGLTAQNDEFR